VPTDFILCSFFFAELLAISTNSLITGLDWLYINFETYLGTGQNEWDFSTKKLIEKRKDLMAFVFGKKQKS